MSLSSNIPNATDWIVYYPECIDKEPKGLWFVIDSKDVMYVKKNTVCLTIEDFGQRNYDVLLNCRGFFESFSKVFVAISVPRCRDEIAAKLSEYFPKLVVLKTNDEAFKDCDTVREYGEKYGRENIEDIARNFLEVENPGLLNYSKIKRPEYLPSILFGITELDRATGGYRKTELCVWTGKRSEGKSTLVNNIVLNAVDDGKRVCIYSGELSPDRMRDWHYLQAAGQRFVNKRVSKHSGNTYWEVSPENRQAIDKWWDGRIYCFDTKRKGIHEEDTIFSLFEYAWYRHGVEIFVLDNLMTVDIKDDREFYRAQTRFSKRLKGYAEQRDVAIHLIAHPRKTGRAEIEGDDVSGSGDIINIADNAFLVSRLPEENDHDADARIRVLKNREYGRRGDVLLLFEESSRRFSDKDRSGFERRYEWECG